MKISPQHPRFQSLVIREKVTKAMKIGIVAPQGLIAHGRGEAFDYIIGERTLTSASIATSAAAALLLASKHPVLSVNGNTAALVGDKIVRLSATIYAPIEINIFHRTREREHAIARYLQSLGAKKILGVDSAANISIKGISSPRKQVDPRGINVADVVLVPLEDGDRAEALTRAGKKVIAIDLNPLSRTSRVASISIVDNVVRALPALVKYSVRMKQYSGERLQHQVSKYNNQSNLAAVIREMRHYLRMWRPS